ncbi:ribokinase [Microcella alkalica]|uniref:Ribokinase n=1 Tax=Microcella alkalica TaxID=355930 RepID=A0A839EDU9_9MICO|nr:ribokinase [Microcella alkalica]MBA8847798.1 ribokinase [Microcella alkalica]
MSAPLAVLGSANIDYTVAVDRHPRPGETVLGGDVVTATGGKGANQALAAARHGARPVFLGAVGDDAGGRQLLDALTVGGVDVSAVDVVADAPTGVALITLARDGENSIVVAPGANARVEAARVVERLGALAGAVLLAQLEVPLDVVAAAAAAVEKADGRVVLNLSPSSRVPDALLAVCDPLVVNESEASDLAGAPVDGPRSAAAAAVALLERCRSIVITLGSEGAVFACRVLSPTGEPAATTGHRPSQVVPVVDTTGAGDAFVGALAAELARGAELAEAVESGVAAGAEAVQWLGAQPPRA